jgi:hypothetical protein
LRLTEVQQPNITSTFGHGQQFARLFGEQRPVRGRVDHHRLELLAQQAALGVLLSISISMVSFSVVSEIAIVPDSECSTPTLIDLRRATSVAPRAVVAGFRGRSPPHTCNARAANGPMPLQQRCDAAARQALDEH